MRKLADPPFLPAVTRVRSTGTAIVQLNIITKVGFPYFNPFLFPFVADSILLKFHCLKLLQLLSMKAAHFEYLSNVKGVLRDDQRCYLSG